MPGEGVTAEQLYQSLRSDMPSPFEARQLFQHVTGIPFHALPTRGKEMVSATVEAALHDLCDRRRGGEPLQYLLGEWEFYGLPFYVGPGVLIPRPETEILVDVALDLSKGRTESPEVLDLCSGSGCVAVALAAHLPGARVTAVELSTAAFAYLNKNIARNRSPVGGVRADLRDYRHPKPVDLLVSNPPYIPGSHVPGLQREVAHEPAMALDGGVDGLDFYRIIARRYGAQMAPGGWVCLEVGIHQDRAVGELLLEEGFRSPDVIRDLSGIGRVVCARR